jgi:hypothetical protein
VTLRHDYVKLEIYRVYNPEFTMISTQSRSSQLNELQTILGDERVTSEMRAFCELCDIENLEKLANMSKEDLIDLSNICKEAVRQCEQYCDVSIFDQMLTLAPGTQRATTIGDFESSSAGQPSTPRSTTLANKVRLTSYIKSFIEVTT